jgi:hypothetical protein
MTAGWMFEDIEKRRPTRGGGGRPRLRLGKTGPRGRIYAVPPKSSGPKVIVKASYAKRSSDSNRHIKAHLKYIQERERGEGEKERTFFDRQLQNIERWEVERVMLQNKGSRAAMHKLILSPGDNSIDIKNYTRECMEALEERLGHKLDWYATIHENTDHHHAHVVIAGKIPGYMRELEKRQERLDAGEFDRIVARELGIVKDARSPEEIKVDQMLNKYDRQMARREEAAGRGDVYLDKGDLRELRRAGDDYMHRERSVDRAIDRAMERELGQDFDKTKERDKTFSLEHWHAEVTRDPELDRGRDDDDERRRERDRERDDFFGR